VKAGHENKRHFRQPADKFWTHLNNLARFWAQRQIFIGFALDLTRMASNTFFNILEQIIFAHLKPPT
jgi:hypothetical protein